MPTYRSANNPLLQPKDVPPSRPGYEVIGVVNTGVARLGSEIILLLRVVERPINSDPAVYPAPVYDPLENEIVLKKLPKDAPGYDFSDPRVFMTPDGACLSAISHLRAARSQDGAHFRVDAAPALSPANAYEAFGLEDPRVTRIGATYYITYVAVSGLGIVTSLASTHDFQAYKRLGVIFPPDNKDVMLFPEKINHRYYVLHRPSSSGFGKPEIWLAELPDLTCWGNHRRLVGLRPGEWDGGRIGGGAPPYASPRAGWRFTTGQTPTTATAWAPCCWMPTTPAGCLPAAQRPSCSRKRTTKCAASLATWCSPAGRCWKRARSSFITARRTPASPTRKYR